MGRILSLTFFCGIVLSDWRNWGRLCIDLYHDLFRPASTSLYLFFGHLPTLLVLSFATTSFAVLGCGTEFGPGPFSSSARVAPHDQQCGLLPLTIMYVFRPLHISVSWMSRKLKEIYSRPACLTQNTGDIPKIDRSWQRMTPHSPQLCLRVPHVP